MAKENDELLQLREVNQMLNQQLQQAQIRINVLEGNLSATLNENINIKVQTQTLAIENEQLRERIESNDHSD